MRLLSLFSITVIFCLLTGTASAMETSGVQHFVGAINHIHSLQMDIYVTEGRCLGSYKYVKSGDSFTLKGNLDKGELQLLETDAAGNFSGYIQLEKKGDFWVGEWYNYNKSIRQPFWIQRVEEKPNYFDCCDDDYWLKRYEGKLLKQEATLILQKRGPEQLSGTLIFMQKRESYSLEQPVFSPNQFRFSLLDQFEVSRGSIVLSELEQDSLKVEMKSSSGQYMKSAFREVARHPLKCQEFSNYYGSYGVSFPKITNHFFGEWLEKQYVEWLADCKKELEKTGGSLKPESRNSHQSYAWTKIRYLNDHLISGWLFFSASWEEELRIIPFNYDLDRNQAIGIDQLFVKDFNFRELLREHTERQVKEAIQRVSPEYHKWFKKANLDQYVVSWEGIWAGSSFDPVFGRLELLLPTNAFRENLNKAYWKQLFEE
jgi:hypothetical protein